MNATYSRLHLVSVCYINVDNFHVFPCIGIQVMDLEEEKAPLITGPTPLLPFAQGRIPACKAHLATGRFSHRPWQGSQEN